MVIDERSNGGQHRGQGQILAPVSRASPTSYSVQGWGNEGKPTLANFSLHALESQHARLTATLQPRAPCSTSAAAEQSQHHREAFEDVRQTDTSTNEEPRLFVPMVTYSPSNVCVEARHNRSLEINFSPVSARCCGPKLDRTQAERRFTVRWRPTGSPCICFVQRVNLWSCMRHGRQDQTCQTGPRVGPLHRPPRG